MGIIEIVVVPSLIYDMHVLEYDYKNVIAIKVYNREYILKAMQLLKEGVNMKNRILLLCLKHHINTVHDYAELMNICDEYADDILNERVPLDETLVMKNCELFKVSREYLLCQI